MCNGIVVPIITLSLRCNMTNITKKNLHFCSKNPTVDFMHFEDIMRALVGCWRIKLFLQFCPLPWRLNYWCKFLLGAVFTSDGTLIDRSSGVQARPEYRCGLNHCHHAMSTHHCGFMVNCHKSCEFTKTWKLKLVSSHCISEMMLKANGRVCFRQNSRQQNTYRLQYPSGVGWTSKSVLSERLVGQSSILTLAERYAGFESIWTSPINPSKQSKLA